MKSNNQQNNEIKQNWMENSRTTRKTIVDVWMTGSGKSISKNIRRKRKREGKWLTEAFFDEIVESMAIAVIGELVIRSRKFLEALWSYTCEITGEFSVFGENHSSSRNETVDQRLLPHFFCVKKNKTLAGIVSNREFKREREEK